jgi:hypothetical protein
LRLLLALSVRHGLCSGRDLVVRLRFFQRLLALAASFPALDDDDNHTGELGEKGC